MQQQGMQQQGMQQQGMQQQAMQQQAMQMGSPLPMQPMMNMGMPMMQMTTVPMEEPKRKMCDFWSRMGQCKHGDSCKFSHGQQNSAPPMGAMGMGPAMFPQQVMMPQGQNGMHQTPEAMQAFAQQAQEMANQYSMQAQALAAQAAAAQAQQQMPGAMGAGMMVQTPTSNRPTGQFEMSQMDQVSFQQFSPQIPQFSPPNLMLDAMPGAQAQAMMYTEAMPGAQVYAQAFKHEPPAKRRRSAGAYAPGGARICDFFARMGECRHGADCKFEHVRAEDLAPGDAAAVGEGSDGLVAAEDREQRGLKRAVGAP